MKHDLVIFQSHQSNTATVILRNNTASCFQEGSSAGVLRILYAPLIILNCSTAPVAFSASSSCILRFTSVSSCSWRRLLARLSLLRRFCTTAGTNREIVQSKGRCLINDDESYNKLLMECFLLFNFHP